MRAVIQRVKSASVTVEGQIVGQIERGLLILLGACRGDSEADLEYLLEKIPNMRIFEDPEGKMNLSLLNLAEKSADSDSSEKYGALVVSQFTLHADTRKGRRPSFNLALEPVEAERLYDLFLERLSSTELTVASGVFGAKMLVALENDGPVTIILDSPDSSQTTTTTD